MYKCGTIANESSILQSTTYILIKRTSVWSGMKTKQLPEQKYYLCGVEKFDLAIW